MVDMGLMREVASKHKGDIIWPYRDIMATHGFDAVADICGTLGGGYTYIPLLRSLLRDAMETEIRARYNGQNHRELARAFGYTDRHLLKILRRAQ